MVNAVPILVILGAEVPIPTFPPLKYDVPLAINCILALPPCPSCKIHSSLLLAFQPRNTDPNVPFVTDNPFHHTLD